MAISLGDAFNRRKKLGADLQSWTQRLGQAGVERRTYRTEAIEGAQAFAPSAGSEKTTQRHYTIEECHTRIQAILREDRDLALRISLTNQRARATVVDLDGVEREHSIPELLVLKSDLIPKLEQVARATPVRADGVSVFGHGDGFVQHRTIRKLEKKKETMTDKGMKVEEVEVIGYDVVETTDYGLPQREAWNEVDRIQEFAHRVKEAINQANRKDLVEL